MQGKSESTTVELSDRAVARIDASRVERNCKKILEQLNQGTKLCAVVKADAYGHGDLWCSQAAVSGGATWLAVATSDEAAELRRHHSDQPLLVMGALTREGMDSVIRGRADLTVWSEEFLDDVIRHASEIELQARIHIKMDSGMGRLGERDPAKIEALVSKTAESEHTQLIGLMTHFATADEPDGEYLKEQIERFNAVVEKVKADYPDCIVHAANSAAALKCPESHFDMVRCGIAIYGLDPFHKDPADHGLDPALSLTSYIAAVKLIQVGESVGYGRKWKATEPTWMAVAPIGYGDGVRRGLSNKGEVLVRDRRYLIAGTVSMDNIAIELGPETDIEIGDRVTLIGQQGEERLLAEEVANNLDTINYEVTCGISSRVRRIFHRDQ